MNIPRVGLVLPKEQECPGFARRQGKDDQVARHSWGHWSSTQVAEGSWSQWEMLGDTWKVVCLNEGSPEHEREQGLLPFCIIKAVSWYTA